MKQEPEEKLVLEFAKEMLAKLAKRREKYKLLSWRDPEQRSLPVLRAGRRHQGL